MVSASAVTTTVATMTMGVASPRGHQRRGHRHRLSHLRRRRHLSRIGFVASTRCSPLASFRNKRMQNARCRFYRNYNGCALQPFLFVSYACMAV
jgi:hypothetical protein